MRIRTHGITAALTLLCAALAGCDAASDAAGQSTADGANGGSSTSDAAAAPDTAGRDGGGGEAPDAVGGATGDTGAGGATGDTGAGGTTDGGGATDGGTTRGGTDDAGATDDGEASIDGSQGADVTAPTGPTFYGDVQPILHEHCQLCHVVGGLGPFPLVTYQNVKPLAPLVAAAVSSRAMPPWSQRDTEECQTQHAFKDDISLAEEDIATIVAWAEGGRPEGDPSLALPAKEPLPSELPGMTMAIATPAYTVSGGKDVFRCFVLDPGFTEDAWINGVHFAPSNTAVAHHALLFLDSEGASVALADETGGFDCFGGAPGDQLIAAWAPGGLPMQLPGGAAVPAPAGARLVLQMHYHPTGLGDAVDSTTVELRTLDAEPPLYAFTALVGNFEHPLPGGDGLQPGPEDAGEPAFLIPAGAPAHVESMAFTLPPVINGSKAPTFGIYAVATHMHYVGSDMLIEVERSSGAAPCSADELSPLLDCLGESCPDVGLGDLQSCAVSSCAGTVGGLTAGCTDCLVGNLDIGSIEGISAACQQASAPTGPPQPTNECLLQTPKWEFHWQRFYAYDEPLEKLPTVGPGDRLKLRCTYDNTLANEDVAEALKVQGLDAPIDVHLGDTTLDEMCLAALQLLYDPGP